MTQSETDIGLRAIEPVNKRKDMKMPPNQGYQASVASAKELLDTARSALPRDVAQAVANADWTFLRDRCDVQALIDHIGTAAHKADFVEKLHAAADKARQQQRQRGRPRKTSDAVTQKRWRRSELLDNRRGRGHLT
jgi:hypothetical protein